MKPPALSTLRQYAIGRSLFTPTTLLKAIDRLGFVQADPIRAPARAQDLMLRHRVRGYRAGDLERRYAQLPIEEDFFVNYGFLPRATQQLMHPRSRTRALSSKEAQLAERVLAFIGERGTVHPQDVEDAFQQGKTRNWFGGDTNACTQLLDALHYRGLLRTARRDSGIRLYALRERHAAPLPEEAAIDALVDVVVQTYAPLPQLSLSGLVSRIRYGAPQWDGVHRAAFKRALRRLPNAQVEGQLWFWPEAENPASRRWLTSASSEQVRLLAPFDPVVWDRRRFEQFWGWAYRFEAYTPAAKRQRGYYALPLLWRDAVVGWANLAVRDGALQADVGYVSGKAPSDTGFGAALDDELQRLTIFLKL